MMNDGCAGCEPGGSRERLDRRSFLGRSALAAVVLALAACSADETAPDLGVSTSIKVSDFAALASVNGIATLSVNRTPIAVVRTGAQSFIALSRVCPHQGSTVGVNGNGFLCPNHGARFDASGNWIGGQRTSNMRSYPTSYDSATDTLTIG